MALVPALVVVVAATEAEQVEVATEDDASVALIVIEYVPGATAMVCAEDVLPLLQRNAIGATPPVADAVHTIFEAEETPTHEVVKAPAALTSPKDSANAIPAIETAALCFASVIF